MPGATAKYALPYPTLTEAPNGPAAFQALAEAVDNVIAASSFKAGLSTARPAHREGLAYYETDTDQIIVSDGAAWLVVWQKNPPVVPNPTPVAFNPVAGAGWTVQSASYLLTGRVVEFIVNCTRTGADLVMSAGGNLVADSEVLTGAGFPAAILPTGIKRSNIMLCRPGVQTGFCWLTQTGQVMFTDGMSGATYTGSGTTYEVRAIYTLGI